MPGTAIAPDWEIPKSEMLRRIETTLARRHGAGAPVRAWS
jgi:radical SAM superfamily enzyme